jgi:flagellar motor switch protein FliM
MSSPASPAETRAYIIERLVGDTGEPERVIEAARALAERAVLPMLAALNAELAFAVGMEVGNVELARFAGARPDGTGSHAMTIAASESSPDALMMVVDPDAISVVLNALFGGDPDLPITPITRPLSPTETTIAGMIFGKLAEAVNGSGERAFNVRFPLPPAITGAEIAKQIVRDGPGVRVDFSIFSNAGRGRLSLLMPQRVLLKHRGDAVAGAANGDFGAKFGEEVMRSAVRLEATMPLTRLTLGQIAGLREGQVIAIDASAQSAALLSARNNTLFVCEFGKLGQNYTVRISHPYDATQELMNGLLPA